MNSGTPTTNPNEANGTQRFSSRQFIAGGAVAVGTVSALVGATTLNPYVFVIGVIVGVLLGGALGAAIAYGPRNRR